MLMDWSWHDGVGGIAKGTIKHMQRKAVER